MQVLRVGSRGSSAMAADRPLPWPPPTRTGHASIEAIEDQIRPIDIKVSNQVSVMVEMIHLLVAHSTAVDTNRIGESKANSDPETVTGPLDAAPNNAGKDKEDGTGAGSEVPAGRESFAPAIQSRRTLVVLLKHRPPNPFCLGSWEPPSLAAAASCSDIQLSSWTVQYQ